MEFLRRPAPRVAARGVGSWRWFAALVRGVGSRRGLVSVVGPRIR
jgi:hypothetical protein